MISVGRLTASTVFAFALVGGGLVAAQTQDPASLSAAQAGATIVWSSPVGTLSSPSSRATFTAVVFQVPTGTPQRGVRIRLEHLDANPNCDIRVGSRTLCADPNAAMLFAESELDRVRFGVARGRFEDLFIAYFQGDAGSMVPGMIIGGHSFLGVQKEDVVGLIDKGIAELKTAPR